MSLKNTMQDITSAKALLSASQEKLKAALDKKRTEKSAWYMERIDSILSLVTHTRTSCNDVNPVNSGRCARCTIMDYKKSGWWDSEYFLNIELLHYQEVPESFEMED